jgi:hypothetical protein
MCDEVNIWADREMWWRAVLLKPGSSYFSVITDKSFHLLYLLFKEMKDEHKFPSSFCRGVGRWTTSFIIQLHFILFHMIYVVPQSSMHWVKGYAGHASSTLRLLWCCEKHSDVQMSVNSSEISQRFESGSPSPTQDDGDHTTCRERRECGAAWWRLSELKWSTSSRKSMLNQQSSCLHNGR